MKNALLTTCYLLVSLLLVQTIVFTLFFAYKRVCQRYVTTCIFPGKMFFARVCACVYERDEIFLLAFLSQQKYNIFIFSIPYFSRGKIIDCTAIPSRILVKTRRGVHLTTSAASATNALVSNANTTPFWSGVTSTFLGACPYRTSARERRNVR